MRLFINDEEYTFEENTTLEIILSHTGIINKKGIAVAVDNQVVTRNYWEHFYPKENDKIVVIKATQGG